MPCNAPNVKHRVAPPRDPYTHTKQSGGVPIHSRDDHCDPVDVALPGVAQPSALRALSRRGIRVCDLADATMGMAFVSTLAPDESFTTMALTINFFRPVWEASLKAEGKVVKRGSSVGYVECEITDEKGRQVAKAASTCMVLRGQSAQGR